MLFSPRLGAGGGIPGENRSFFVVTDDLGALIEQAVLAARNAGEFAYPEQTVSVTIETPKNKLHGDYSSNIALTLKKATGLNDSRDIAARILRHLPPDNPLIDRVEIAGPGFMNFYLKPVWLHDTLLRTAKEDSCYGAGQARCGETLLIE